MSNHTKSYAAFNATDPLGPYEFNRRDLGPADVQIGILYCGVCHSDIHQVRSEWSDSKYPMVPGHEIIGRVINTGNQVKKYKIGETVGVGVFVDSCRKCRQCLAGQENYCVEGMTGTYNDFERDGVTPTMGGYSTQIVVDENYVLRIPAKLDISSAAPLLCAGITTYSPLRYAGVTKGTRVAIAGLGGLGHMGVKFAVSFGADVTVLSTSAAKKKDAMRLGAHDFLLTTDKATLKTAKDRFDVILDTVSANHDYGKYLRLLGLNGRLMIVSLPSKTPEADPFALINNRRSITGSMVGGLKETQEMLDYCAENNISPETELIPMQQINAAYERMLKSDVHYRFVIDLASLK